MAILHRVSWWLEHAQANSERIILTTLHYTIVVRKVSVAMYHVYPWISWCEMSISVGELISVAWIRPHFFLGFTTTWEGVTRKVVVSQGTRGITQCERRAEDMGGGAWNWTLRAERRYLDPKREHPTMSMVAYHLVHFLIAIWRYTLSDTRIVRGKKHGQC